MKLAISEVVCGRWSNIWAVCVMGEMGGVHGAGVLTWGIYCYYLKTFTFNIVGIIIKILKNTHNNNILL